jgi:hypothetical protein
MIYEKLHTYYLEKLYGAIRLEVIKQDDTLELLN